MDSQSNQPDQKKLDEIMMNSLQQMQSQLAMMQELL